MARILSYKSKRDNLIVIVSLIVSIVVTNSIIVFSADENIRSYFSNITSTLTVGVPLVIGFVMVFRYKRSIKGQKEKHKILSQQDKNNVHSYYDNNKMHFSICFFLVLWFAAHLIWTFQYQQSSDIAIQDALWFIGYGFFGYFLYSLYYHFFRREFEPFVLILMAIVIVIVLVFVVDIVSSTLRLLSAQTIDNSVLLVTVAYPILDAILVFPAVLIFLAVRRINNKRMNATPEQKIEVNTEEDKSSSPTNVSSIWILLLSISMILSAIGDTGFAFSTAYGPDTVQREVWVWDIFYTSSGLCLAAALIGYKYFFIFNRIDKLQH